MKCILRGSLTIAAVAETKQKLLQALENGGPLELDTREVTEVDAAGLQLFLATRQSAKRNKIPFKFPVDDRGPVVQEGLRILGLTDETWITKATCHGEANPRCR